MYHLTTSVDVADKKKKKGMKTYSNFCANASHFGVVGGRDGKLWKLERDSGECSVSQWARMGSR